MFGTFLAGPAYHYWFNYLDELPAHAYRLKQLRQRGEFVEIADKYQWSKVTETFFLSFALLLFPFAFFYLSFFYRYVFNDKESLLLPLLSPHTSAPC